MKEVNTLPLIVNSILFGIICLVAEVIIFLTRAFLGPEVFTIVLFTLLALIGITSKKMFPRKWIGFLLSTTVFLLCFAPFATLIYALKPSARTVFYTVNYLIIGILMMIIGRRIIS